MTAANAMIFVHNIEQSLSALDPAHATTYQSKVKAYEIQLADLESWRFQNQRRATFPRLTRR